MLRISLSPLNKRYVNQAYGLLILSGLWVVSYLSRIIRYSHLYWKLVTYFLKKTYLFDKNFYLKNYIDVVQNNFDPIYHYAAFGEKEGRNPNPLFDTRFYKGRTHERLKNVNALLHYFYRGQYRRYSPSAWFDINFYITNNRDVINLGFEPLRHYLEFGGLEGRSPNPQFDGYYYLHKNPEITAAKLNPLIHYLEYGRWHNWPTRELSNKKGDDDCSISYSAKLKIQESDLAEDCYRQIIANQSHWSKKNKKSQAEGIVDVIIPVYRNSLVTLQCIQSIFQAKENTTFEVIVIDDCSPEVKLSEYLNDLAKLKIITLIKNLDNRGFVYSANLGMKQHSERDIILLNSDTQVFGNWIERLRCVATLDPKVASVTPLSNNATICSYPRTLFDNPYPLEISYECLDSLTAKVNMGVLVEAPTGVGFCMYIKREAINAIGILDLKSFGRGYGEENDWCQRAVKAGWKNLITADTFVYHIGHVSFGGFKEMQLNRAMRILVKRYPLYCKNIQEFIRQDPLKSAREKLDWARLQLQSQKFNVLMINHQRGGGSERYLQEVAKKAKEEGKGVYYLRPVRKRPDLVCIKHDLVKQLHNIPYFEFKDTKLLAKNIGQLNITTINSHGLVDYAIRAPLYLANLAKQIEATLIIDIHDYTLICPRINLINKRNTYCGEPPEIQCNKCLKSSSNSFGATNIQHWRNINYESLRRADLIYAPSQDLIDRVAKYYPDIKIEKKNFRDLKSHDGNKLNYLSLNSKKTSSVFKVLIIGSIGYIKGYSVLHDIAKDALVRKLPLKYVVQGYTINDLKLKKLDVVILGKYSDNDAVSICKAIDPNVVFFTSIWPETYSFTLDIAFDAGLPVMAFDIGAIAERLKSNNWLFELISLDNLINPSAINDQIMKFMHTLESNRILSFENASWNG